MDSINQWLIGPISKPNLIWGNWRQGHIHECPVCHVSLLTGEKPGFCCGPNGSKYGDVPPLPPLPFKFNTFLNHPRISCLSRVLNLLYSFVSLETTDTFLTLEGAPAFVAIQGKVYHRIRPSHTTSAVRWFFARWTSLVFKSPVLRPEKDRTRTGLLKDCSLGLSNFKMKDRKKTGLYGPV